MSTRYNTGNPIESTDVRDMSDNAKNFDDFANSKSNEFTDRFGVERKTIHGMNSQFDSHILNMGFTRVGTFAAGATLTNPRQTLLWAIADGGDGQEYGWSGSFIPSGKVVPPLSTPNTTGGISVGAWISRFDPELRIAVREAMRRSYAEAGLNLVAGSFEAGGTVTTATDVLLYEADGKAYSWGGTLSKTVDEGSTPSSSGGVGAGAWELVAYATLRGELANSDGAELVGFQQSGTGAVAMTQHDFNKVYVNVLQFGADPTGVADSTTAIQAAIDAVYSRGGGEVFIPATTGTAGVGDNSGYRISATVQVKPFVNIRGEGFSSCMRATTALPDGVLQLIDHRGIGGRYIENIRILGTGAGIGIGTNLAASDDTAKFLYGWSIRNVLVENFATGYQFQGMWHSTLDNITSSACTIGLDLWGQNVSVHITGCHFRRDGIATEGSRGINIRRRVYAWSPDQANGSVSEAIIIDGETMSIGLEYGIYIDGGLDFHFSNLDLDYCQLGGIRVLDINSTFTVSDSWIAADAAGTGAFIGVAFIDGPYLGSYAKKLTGLQINSTNASGGGGNIGIQAGAGTKYLQISDSTLSGGDVSLYLSGTSASTVRGCKLEKPLLYRNGCQNVTICDSELAGIDETGKPAGTFNYYRSNTGTPGTNGFMSITVPGNGTTATGTIPNGSAYMFYVVTKLDRDPSASADRLSVSGSTVTVNRSTPVALPVGCYLEYKAT